MTDAAHLLTDVGSMSVSLFSLWVSTRPPTKTMSFGWHRSGEPGGARPHGTPAAGAGADSSRAAETLGALASVLSIWVVTGALVYLAAARIVSNDYEIEARAMLATSASAVGVNLVYVPPGAARPGPASPQPLPLPHVCPWGPKTPSPGPQVTFRPGIPSPRVPKRCLPLFPVPPRSWLPARVHKSPGSASPAPPSSTPQPCLDPAPAPRVPRPHVRLPHPCCASSPAPQRDSAPHRSPSWARVCLPVPPVPAVPACGFRRGR